MRQSSVLVEIKRFTDASFPGFVECVLRDALGKEWSFVDKVPVFTTENLDAGSEYPRPAWIDCEVLREWTDVDGRARCMTEFLDVEADDGSTRFEIFSDQLKAD